MPENVLAREAGGAGGATVPLERANETWVLRTSMATDMWRAQAVAELSFGRSASIAARAGEHSLSSPAFR